MTCSPFTDTQIESLLRAPFRDFRIFSFNLSSRIGPIKRSCDATNNNSELWINNLLRDPGTYCMTKILTHKTLIFVFHGPSRIRKTWVPALNFPDFFIGLFLPFKQFFTWGAPTSELLAIFHIFWALEPYHPYIESHFSGVI